jgi:hypothetical protein
MIGSGLHYRRRLVGLSSENGDWPGPNHPLWYNLERRNMSGALQMRDKALLPTDQPVTEFV